MPSTDDDLRLKKVEHLLDGPMMLLCVGFIAAELVPLFPRAPAGLSYAAERISSAVWVLFTVEYLTLLAIAADKRVFLRTHLLELIMVLLPALRVLRVLRILRLLHVTASLTVVARLLKSLGRVFQLYGLRYVVVAFIVVLFGVSALILVIEGAGNPGLDTYPECVWWGLVTMTTVGYGDAYPVTLAGRALAAVFMFVGIALLGVVTATIASVFVGIERRSENAEVAARLDAVLAELHELRREVRGSASGEATRGSRTNG